MAVLAWYFGKDGFAHKDSGRGGLLFEASIVGGDETVTIASDTSWRATLHPGFLDRRDEAEDGTQPNYRLAESNVVYDAREAAAMEGWEQPGFDDSAWGTATAFGRAVLSAEVDRMARLVRAARLTADGKRPRLV